METLEKSVQKYETNKSKEKSERKYGGLILLDDKTYAGPTGIKYWM